MYDDNKRIRRRIGTRVYYRYSGSRRFRHCANREKIWPSFYGREYRHEYRDEDNKIERVEYEYEDAERGDIVFYDDSDAIETTMVVDGKKERVEIIGVMSVVAMVKKESLKGNK